MFCLFIYFNATILEFICENKFSTSGKEDLSEYASDYLALALRFIDKPVQLTSINVNKLVVRSN